MPVITISRQFGSDGDAVVERLCSMTGYRYLDKRLMQAVASEVGLSPNEVVDFSEDHYKALSFFQSLFGPRQRVVAEVPIRQRDTTGATQISVTTLDEAQCIDLVRVAVKKAHETGSVVIVGRGSQVILRDKPDTLHVRIEAPLEVRIRRVQTQEQISPAEARELIARRDLSAAQYLERFFNVDWTDRDLYHLVINTGRCSADTAARIIARAAEALVTDEPAAPETAR